jgi:predicted RNase H-like HicB family nuclease
MRVTHHRQHYVAVVRKEADSDFRAFFPDFSCVVASAPTLAEAIKKAAQALALNAKQTLADGKPLPEPSGLSQILADPAYRTDVLAVVPLELPETPT